MTVLAGWPRRQEKGREVDHRGVMLSTVNTTRQQKHASFVLMTVMNMKRFTSQTTKQVLLAVMRDNKNKLAPYGTGGRLLLTANFKVM